MDIETEIENAVDARMPTGDELLAELTKPELSAGGSQDFREARSMGVVALERSILSSLMSNSADALLDLGLKPDHFSGHEHREVFSAMAALAQKGFPLDPATIFDQILASNANSQITLAGLRQIKSEETSKGIQARVGLLKDKFRTRCLDSALQIALNSDSPFDERVQGLLDSISALEDEQAQHTRSMREIMVSVLERLEDLESGKVNRLPFGIKSLDEKTGGMGAGELIVAAGRPGMGKTAMTLAPVLGALGDAEKKRHVVYFTLEMSGEGIVQRMMSSTGGISSGFFKDCNGDSAEFQWPLLTRAIEQLEKYGDQFFANDKPLVSLSYLESELRKIKRKAGQIDLIVVDYVGLMERDQKKSTADAIAEITMGLKRVAKQFDCPVLALQQLNRSVESRPDKRPVMSDLRDSGGIEQDADLILMLYRDDYYNEDSLNPGIAEIIIRKQREGQTGTCYAQFEGEFTRFSDLPEGWFPANPEPAPTGRGKGFRL